MTERVFAFEGVENFRDYGDYATAAGLRLARGRLLRSGHHARASDADLVRLAGFAVGVVVDLRRASERAAQPCRRPAGFAGRVIESEDVAEGEAPHVTFLRTTDLTEHNVRAFMLDTYRAMPFDERHRDLFSRYFRALAEVEGAVLIHCAAGKDRTGLLAALTHHLAGVNEQDLFEDYLLTNSAVRLEARTPEIAAQIERSFGRKASDAAVRAFLGVEPGFLHAGFGEIRARHGTLDAYLEQALGVDRALRERLEARLLA
jgi:protein tyrosine/serine phosphatase